MLTRISLIVALIAGLAVGGLNFFRVKTIITDLRTNLANETHAKEEAQRNLASTKRELDKTAADLKQTQDTLATTTTERDTAVKTAAAATAKATQLSEELDNTKKTLGDTQAELASFKAAGMTADQVLAMSKTLKQSQDALAEAQVVIKTKQRQNEKLQARLDKYEGEDHTVYLPPSLKGQVTASDPKWEFVVVNVGEDQGVQQEGELLVNRNGKLVAKVIVTTVQKNQSIANVMPGWKIEDVMEGDQVLY